MKRAWWVLTLLAACGGDEPADSGERVTPGTYVDRMAGADPWLAVIIEEQGAAAFVCGGAQTLETHTRFFVSETADLHFERDGWTLELDPIDGALTGALIAPDGEQLPIEATSPADALAGLYTAVDSGCRAGVIIASSQDSQGAWCDTLGNFSQVTPLAPLEQGPDGIEVVAEDTPGGPRNFFVQPAAVADIAAGP